VVIDREILGQCDQGNSALESIQFKEILKRALKSF